MDVPSKEHKCDQCSYSFHRERDLSKHKESAANQKHSYCYDCDFTCCTKQGLARHRNDVHKRAGIPQEINVNPNPPASEGHQQNQPEHSGSKVKDCKEESSISKVPCLSCAQTFPSLLECMYHMKETGHEQQNEPNADSAPEDVPFQAKNSPNNGKGPATKRPTAIPGSGIPKKRQCTGNPGIPGKTGQGLARLSSLSPLEASQPPNFPVYQPTPELQSKDLEGPNSSGCGKSLKDDPDWVFHQRQCNPARAPDFKCEKCNAEFYYLLNFKEHNCR